MQSELKVVWTAAKLLVPGLDNNGDVAPRMPLVYTVESLRDEILRVMKDESGKLYELEERQTRCPTGICVANYNVLTRPVNATYGFLHSWYLGKEEEDITLWHAAERARISKARAD